MGKITEMLSQAEQKALIEIHGLPYSLRSKEYVMQALITMKVRNNEHNLYPLLNRLKERELIREQKDGKFILTTTGELLAVVLKQAIKKRE